MLVAEKQNGQVVIIQKNVPVPQARELLVQVQYCGICGSDYQKYLHHDRIQHWGHEIIGRVMNSDERDGTLISLKTDVPCGFCDACKSSMPTHCKNGSKARFNGFSQYISVPKKCMVSIGNLLNPRLGILIEPLYTAIHLVHTVHPEADDRFAILGNGTIALLSAFYLQQLGCHQITVFARANVGKRAAFLQRIGIHMAEYNAMQEQLQDCNKIIDTAPYHTLNDIIMHASPYSCITFNGISTPRCVELDLQTWHFKNLAIIPSFPHPQGSFLRAIELLEQNSSILNSLITHFVSLEELPQVLHCMQTHALDHIKIAVDMGG